MASIILTITRSKTLLRAIGIAFEQDIANGGERTSLSRYNCSCLEDSPIALARADLVLLDVGVFRGSVDARSKNHLQALASRQALVLLHGAEDKKLLTEIQQWASAHTLQKPFSSSDLEQKMETILGVSFAAGGETVQNTSDLADGLMSGQRARPAFDLEDSGDPIEQPKFVGEIGVDSPSISTDALAEFAKLQEKAESRVSEIKKHDLDVGADPIVEESSQSIEKVLTSEIASTVALNGIDAQELQAHLRKLVEEYCKKNFSRVARQVLEDELSKVQTEHDRIRYGSSQV